MMTIKTRVPWASNAHMRKCPKTHKELNYKNFTKFFKFGNPVIVNQKWLVTFHL